MFNKKRKHFNKMLKDVEVQIWEQELSKFKALQVRERERRQRDQAVDALAKIEAQLKAEPKNEELLANKEAVEKKVKYHENQLRAIDERIVGRPNEETGVPEGGIDQALTAFVELREYVKGFIKYNC